ncbi:TPA: hypothetical protein MYV49_005200 [Klebsiella aerogenes]|uniref:hypothetical protein n=1 Tax=Klebsiella aerogenes TaxID=548 RepID=UPI00388FAA83|nr:hypothetical protein [Klebsiella aerogenes]
MIVQNNHIAGTGFIPVMMDLSINNCGDSRYVVKEKITYPYNQAALSDCIKQSLAVYHSK